VKLTSYISAAEYDRPLTEAAAAAASAQSPVAV
jgi:hypothetical protein